MCLNALIFIWKSLKKLEICFPSGWLFPFRSLLVKYCIIGFVAFGFIRVRFIYFKSHPTQPMGAQNNPKILLAQCL